MNSLVTRLRHRVQATYLRSNVRRLRGPSFVYKQLEAVRVRQSMRELGCKDPAFEIDAKDDTHAWAVRLGVRTPRLLGTFEDVHSIDWTSVPDRFVLKPTHGSTSAGVYLLSRQEQGWIDLVSRRELGPAEIASELDDLVRGQQMSGSILMEELIQDPRVPGAQPTDYKVSMFFGRVGLIEAKSHRFDEDGRPFAGWRVFDESWRDIGNVFQELDIDETIPPPINGDALLEVARRVSASIPRAYLRVDMLEDARGPVLGEVTPEPGGEYLPKPRMDRLLGRYWEDAEVRLRVRAARLGSLSPTNEPIDEAIAPRSLRS